MIEIENENPYVKITLTLEGLFFFILLVLLLLSHIISKVVRHDSGVEGCYMYLEIKLMSLRKYEIKK